MLMTMAFPVASLPLEAFLKRNPLEPSSSGTSSSSTSEASFFIDGCDPRLLAGYAARHIEAITVPWLGCWSHDGNEFMQIATAEADPPMRGFVLMTHVQEGFVTDDEALYLRQWSYENGEIHYGNHVTDEFDPYLMDENGFGIADTLMDHGDDEVDPWAGSQVSDFKADPVPDDASSSGVVDRNLRDGDFVPDDEMSTDELAAELIQFRNEALINAAFLSWLSAVPALKTICQEKVKTRAQELHDAVAAHGF